MSGRCSLEASFITDFWNDQLAEHDRQWLFLVLLGLVVSFGFIRFSTRMMRSPRVTWWPGSVVSDSGVHVHHLVFGIVLMIAAGAISFAGFAVSPIYEICAFLFGIGIGLTIDEFALWLYLDDVYWAKEGRASVDAAALAVGLLGIVLLGVRPFDISDNSAGDLIVSLVGVLVLFACVAICILKHRLFHGAVGFFLFPLALYGACRIGKPDSPWAKRFYGERNPKKQAKAEQRFRPDRRTERFKEAFRDAIGGSPTDEYDAKVERREERKEERQATRAERRRLAQLEVEDHDREREQRRGEHVGEDAPDPVAEEALADHPYGPGHDEGRRGSPSRRRSGSRSRTRARSDRGRARGSA